MAKPTNRSPWTVKLSHQDLRKFRLRSQALAFLTKNGHDDPEKLPRGALKQLETAFEVQVIRKDKEGNVVRRSETFDTYAQAEKYAAKQDAELERILAAHLLAFAEGVGFTVPRPRGLEVRLAEVDAPRRVRCHDGQLLSFDVTFWANMLLPTDVGIGKSASHGFGVAYPLPDRVRPALAPPRPARLPGNRARTRRSCPRPPRCPPRCCRP